MANKKLLTRNQILLLRDSNSEKKRAFQWYIICGVTLRFKQKSLFLEIWNLAPCLIDDSEDLNLGIAMYNLIEYSSNDSETTRSLWFYSKDEATNFKADIPNDNDSKTFENKAKLLANTETQPNPNNPDGILKNATIAV